MTTSITLAYFSTPEVIEGSDGEATRKELQKRIAKKDWRLQAPKLPNVTPSALMSTPPVELSPQPVDDTTSEENIPSDDKEENTVSP